MKNEILAQYNKYSRLNPDATKGSFSTNSATAIHKVTGKQVHPKGFLKNCFTVRAARSHDGESVILVDLKPTLHQLKNWNTGKYQNFFAKGTLINAEQLRDLPLGDKLASAYSFKSDKIILVNKIRPA